MINLINSSNSTSIHFRRGDYTNSIKAKSLHDSITSSYYYDSIDLIKNRIADPNFFIFSDDPEWVRNNFNLENFIIVDLNKDLDPLYDLYLMSICKHNIIANSTFSLWGALLGNYNDKITIAPKKWNNSNVDFKDLFPNNFITI